MTADIIPAEEVIGKKRGRKSKAEKTEELQKQMEQAQSQTKDEDPEIASIRASLERIAKKNAPKAAADKDAPIITDRPKEAFAETAPKADAEIKIKTDMGELAEYLIDAAKPMENPKKEDYNPEFVKAMDKAAEKHTEKPIEKITSNPDSRDFTYPSTHVSDKTVQHISNEKEMKETISVAESGNVINVATKAEDGKVAFIRGERRYSVAVPAKEDSLVDRMTYILDVQRGKRTVPSLVSFSVTSGIRYIIVDVNVNLIEDAWKEYKADRKEKSNPEEFMDMLYKILHTSIPRMYRAVAPIHLN